MVFKERSIHSNGISLRQGSADKRPTDVSERTVERVRIDDIFAAELSIADNRRGEDSWYRQAVIKLKYETYIDRITDSVSKYLGFGDKWRDHPEVVRRAINEADERRLFGAVQDILYDELKISYKRDCSMTSSVESNRFNYHTSSVMVADALTRMGKPINLVLMPRHIQIMGESMTFNTTYWSRSSISSKRTFEKAHRDYSIIGSGDDLLAETYSICAHAIISDNNRMDEALELCRSAERLNNICVRSLTLAGYILSSKDRHKEAVEYYIKALDANPYNPYVDINIMNLSLSAINISEPDRVIPVVNRVLKVTPKSAVAVFYKGFLLMNKGSRLRALYLYNRAIRLDKSYHGPWIGKAEMLRQFSPRIAKKVLRDGLEHVKGRAGRAAIESMINDIGIKPRGE